MQDSMGHQQATPVELAWLAGVIDGEGCFMVARYIRKRSIRFDPRFLLGNTDVALVNHVDKIMRLIRVGASISEVHLSGNRKDSFQMQVQRLAYLERLIEAILPYTVGKKDRAVLMLDYIKRLSSGEAKRQDGEETYIAMALANKKGFVIFPERLRDVGITPHQNGVHQPALLEETRLAWLAGFIDGEGSFSITKTRRTTNKGFRYDPIFTMGNTDLPLLYHASTTMRDLGMDFHIAERQPEGNRRFRYAIQVWSKQSLHTLITATLPYLVGKKARAELMGRYLTRLLAKEITAYDGLDEREAMTLANQRGRGVLRGQEQSIPVLG
jgi:hypothetical protein